MGLPIYQSKNHELSEMTNASANKGLIFERFFNQYQLENLSNIGPKGNIKPKVEANKDFLVNKISGVCGDDKQLGNHAQHQIALAKAQSGKAKAYQLDGHFITGMGNSHPVENGFSWHYTLGVPYLSGSQVKGLVRSLIEQFYVGDDKKVILYQWFGSESKDAKQAEKEAKVGELIFFDALPMKKPKLTVDIMTPHMGEWYAKGGNIECVENDTDKIPADWHAPTPLLFLAVEKATFWFSIGKRRKSDIDITTVFNYLDKALQYLGAGAKTQTGYGYMSIGKDAEKTETTLLNTIREKQEKQQKAIEAQKEEEKFADSLQGKSTLEKGFLTEQKNNKWNKVSFVNAKPDQSKSDAEIWLGKLDEEPDEAVLQRFKQQMEDLYKGIYDNPDKKKGKKKDKPVFKSIPIAIIKRLKEMIESQNK
ncbi:MAG: type III-B CRISPR module RAMP protein Cmr6 [Ostreibacterium sp.]